VNVALILLVFEVSVFFIVAAFGLRFIFYDEDGPNLDTIYKRFFRGRIHKRYAEFTRTVGWLLVTMAAGYFYLLLRNDWASLIAERIANP